MVRTNCDKLSVVDCCHGAFQSLVDFSPSVSLNIYAKMSELIEFRTNATVSLASVFWGCCPAVRVD